MRENQGTSYIHRAEFNRMMEDCRQGKIQPIRCITRGVEAEKEWGKCQSTKRNAKRRIEKKERVKVRKVLRKKKKEDICTMTVL